MGRAPCCDKANVKKGPWSPEEDAKLKDYIERHGRGDNWISLPQKADLRRCGKSCRLRWLNYLRPNIKHGEFSDEEDRIICSLFTNIGSRWSIIAAQLPGRTDNDIKNYWNTRLKKKLMGLSTLNSSYKRPSNNATNYKIPSHLSPLSSSPYPSPSPPPPPPPPPSSSMTYLTAYDQVSVSSTIFNANNYFPNFGIVNDQEDYLGPKTSTYKVQESGAFVSSCSSSDDGVDNLFDGVHENQSAVVPNCGEAATDYSCLEKIKDLISFNFCNNLNFLVDESTTEGHLMYSSC